MVGTFKGFTIRQDELFTTQLELIAPARFTDEALDAVVWAVGNDPEVYPVIPGTNRLRVAKSLLYQRQLVTIPPLRIWFTIEDGGIILFKAVDVLEDWNTPDTG